MGRLETVPALFSPLGGGRLIIVSGWGSCLNCSTVAPSDPVGHTVFGLDAMKGTLSWAFSTGCPVDTSPQIYKDAVLVAACGSVYSLLASDGAKVNWVKVVASAGEHITQVVVHSKLRSAYVCTDGGRVYGLSLVTGDTLWTWQRRDGDSGGELNIQVVSDSGRDAYVSSTAGWVAKLLLPPITPLNL